MSDQWVLSKFFGPRQGAVISNADADERVGDISVDLQYELQSKMFDQLATVSVAGAGLAVTLIGSMLSELPESKRCMNERRLL